MGEVALVLSPHLDDAALSCPTYQRRRKRSSRQCSRMAMRRFTSKGVPKTARHYANTSGPCTWAFSTRPTARRNIGTFAGSYSDALGNIAATFALWPRQSSGLFRNCNRRDILAPLAIGNHVDHRVVRDAALAVVPRDRLLSTKIAPTRWRVRTRTAEIVEALLRRNVRASLPWNGDLSAHHACVEVGARLCPQPAENIPDRSAPVRNDAHTPGAQQLPLAIARTV